MTSLTICPRDLTEQLFQFIDAKNKAPHIRFFRDMIAGILGSQSTVVANIARFMNEPIALLQTEKRLCRMPGNKKIAWDE